MTPALCAFEAAVLAGQLGHAGSPLLRWAVANCAVDTDSAGNRKLSKQRSRGRIDPAMAAVLVVAEASRQPAPADYSLAGLSSAVQS